mmetsp:Transcript_39552/g.91817  ORF Transcript_39552/g.91817 Transcript_39552/m.91817 type:complete len:213 (+) Transcript_39552:433-1071(+)
MTWGAQCPPSGLHRPAGSQAPSCPKSPQHRTAPHGAEGSWPGEQCPRVRSAPPPTSWLRSCWYPLPLLLQPLLAGHHRALLGLGWRCRRQTQSRLQRRQSLLPPPQTLRPRPPDKLLYCCPPRAHKARRAKRNPWPNLQQGGALRHGYHTAKVMQEYQTARVELPQPQPNSPFPTGPQPLQSLLVEHRLRMPHTANCTELRRLLPSAPCSRA